MNARSDITVVVDRALKMNYLSVRYTQLLLVSFSRSLDCFKSCWEKKDDSPFHVRFGFFLVLLPLSN